MKNRIAKTVPMALALVLMLTMAAGCPRPAPEVAPIPQPDPEVPRTITITDSAGREVELTLPVERVIVMSHSAAEIVHAIGAADRVIAITDWIARDEFLTGFYGKPSVGLWSGAADLERIIELGPQLVITHSAAAGVDLDAQVEALTAAGIPVVAIDAIFLPTLFDDIKIVGQVFEEEKAAARLVEFLQVPLDLIEGRVEALSPEEKVRVYAEMTWRKFLAWGPGSCIHKKIETAGGVNIFADIGASYLDIDPEKVIARNPQVILMTSYSEYLA